MKIAVMGTGGTGGYFGGLLAKQGNDVTFIARGAHLAAIREKGLQVRSVHGDFTLAPAHATNVPAEIGTVDLVLFCTKTYDTETAASAIKPIVGSQTTVLSLQNGIDAAERIGAVVGSENMLGGVAYVSSAVEAPGVIKQISQFRRIVMGELNGGATTRVRAIHEVLLATGAAAEIAQNIRSVLWAKFVFICPASAVGSLTRLPMGGYREVPETRTIVAGLMQEVEAVAAAHGVPLAADVVDASLRFMDQAAPHIKPSMQLDIEAGHRTEVESMIGVLGRKGREVGVPTPMADMVYGLLLPIELTARSWTAA